MIRTVRLPTVAALTAMSLFALPAASQEVTGHYRCVVAEVDEFTLLIVRMPENREVVAVMSGGLAARAVAMPAGSSSRMFRVAPGPEGTLPITLITLRDDLTALVSYREGAAQVSYGASCEEGRRE